MAIFLLICIIAVSLGITYSKGSGNNGDGPAPLNGSPFKFSDTFDSQFKAVPVYPTWFSSQLEPDQTSTFTYTRSEDGSILQYNATSQTSSVLILSSDYPTLSFSGYELSPARNLALLVSNVTQVYRHSYKASYSLVDIKTKQVTPSFPLSRPTIQLATWAPQGELIAFVENNNVFILTEPTNPTSQTTITVTTSGTPDGTIVNGIPDWVYEEEVLASNSALWWSPSSARLCFLSFNDTNVPFYTFPHYPLTPDNPYTEPVTFRYPKPGFPNPSMTVSVFDVASQRTVALNLTSSLVSDPATQDFYITQVHWVDDTNLLSVRQYSRAQNESLLLVCNVTVALEEQDAQQALAPCYAVTRQVSTTGWLENYSSSLKFIFHETGSSFQIFDIVEVNGFAQIVTYTVPLPLSTAGADSNIATPTPITGDSWEIVSIDSIDTSNYQSQGQVIVYFTAYGKQAQAGVPSDPTQNHIYSWSNTKPAVFNCLSCEADPGCNWNSASYDIVSKYMLLTCSGPKVPYQTVRSLSKFTTGKRVGRG